MHHIITLVVSNDVSGDPRPFCIPYTISNSDLFFKRNKKNEINSVWY